MNPFSEKAAEPVGPGEESLTQDAIEHTRKGAAYSVVRDGLMHAVQRRRISEVAETGMIASAKNRIKNYAIAKGVEKVAEKASGQIADLAAKPLIASGMKIGGKALPVIGAAIVLAGAGKNVIGAIKDAIAGDKDGAKNEMQQAMIRAAGGVANLGGSATVVGVAAGMSAGVAANYAADKVAERKRQQPALDGAQSAQGASGVRRIYDQVLGRTSGSREQAGQTQKADTEEVGTPRPT
jgi:hypothetical protein